MKSTGRLRLVQPSDPAVASDEARLPPLPVIYDKYCRYVASIAARLLGREDEVKDVVQDVFVAAMEHLHDLERAESVKSWLGAITVNKATSRLRRRKVRKLFGLDVATYTPPAAPASPDQSAYLARLYRELDRLPTNHRVAWTLRYVEEQPLEDVARLCGCSLATAKRWIAAAHEAICDLEANAHVSKGQAR